MQLGTTINVKKCQRNHRCWWCGEVIEKGESYRKWTWKESQNDIVTIKVHPECGDAWHELSDLEGWPVEVMFGEYTRGRFDNH